MKKILAAALVAVALAGCGSDNDETSLCEQICERSAAAACPNDDPATCVSECNALYSFFPQCKAQLEAYGACAVTASFACDGDGMAATTADCSTQEAALLACLPGPMALPQGWH